MNLYIKFLHLKNTDKKLTSDLKPHLLHILNYIAVHNHFEEVPIRSAQLLLAEDLGSPATIHKSYQYLLKRGYLKHSYSKVDGRLRFIELSEKSKNLFHKLELILKKAIR